MGAGDHGELDGERRQFASMAARVLPCALRRARRRHRRVRRTAKGAHLVHQDELRISSTSPRARSTISPTRESSKNAASC